MFCCCQRCFYGETSFRRIRSSLVAASSTLAFLAVMEASNIGLSAYLTFSEQVLYGYDLIPHPDWWTRGDLVDQQLGGLIIGYQVASSTTWR